MLNQFHIIILQLNMYCGITKTSLCCSFSISPMFLKCNLHSHSTKWRLFFVLFICLLFTNWSCDVRVNEYLPNQIVEVVIKNCMYSSLFLYLLYALTVVDTLCGILCTPTSFLHSKFYIFTNINPVSLLPLFVSKPTRETLKKTKT